MFQYTEYSSFYILRGLLSYSDKISKHWPEFDQKGKGEATVSDLLTHGVSTNTVMILSFRTDMPGQTVQTQIRAV